MILAAGLTPAWQQILSFECLTTGQVNRARSTLWCGSGKVLNVGAALCHLGAPSLTLSPLGGTTGIQIRDDFARREISARWVQTAAATRVCTTILDESTGTTTELVENSSPLTAGELDQFDQTLELRGLRGPAIDVLHEIDQVTEAPRSGHVVAATQHLSDLRGNRTLLQRRAGLSKGPGQLRAS